MIEIRTTTIDATGTGNFQEIAPNIYRDTGTGKIIIDDGIQAIQVTVTAE